MIRLIRRVFSPRKIAAEPPSPALKGAPLRARIKTYSAETGRVYQYVFKGYRLPGDNAREYVFELSPGRNHIHATVRLPDEAVNSARETIARPLIDQELYAVAKLALFAAFDAAETSETLRAAIVPGPEQIVRFLEQLGRL